MLGHGAGAFLDPSHVGGGIFSWPVQVLTEGGMVAGVLLAGMFAVLLRTVFQIRGKSNYGYVMAVLAAMAHYSVVSDYWMPWIWFLVILVYRARETGVVLVPNLVPKPAANGEHTAYRILRKRDRCASST